MINKNSTKLQVEKVIIKFIKSKNKFYDGHHRPQFEYLINDNEVINDKIIIFKTETLIEDAKKFGFRDFNSHDNKGKYNVNYFDYLSETSIKIIK